LNPLPRPNQSSDDAIKEFLDKGGKIQSIPYGQRTENVSFAGSFYGKRKKQEPVVETGEEDE
jgi:hypothetical protein